MGPHFTWSLPWHPPPLPPPCLLWLLALLPPHEGQPAELWSQEGDWTVGGGDLAGALGQDQECHRLLAHGRWVPRIICLIFTVFDTIHFCTWTCVFSFLIANPSFPTFTSTSLPSGWSDFSTESEENGKELFGDVKRLMSKLPSTDDKKEKGGWTETLVKTSQDRSEPTWRGSLRERQWRPTLIWEARGDSP